jgi:16S rRNA (cytosine967-C5)-methyltransferase
MKPRELAYKILYDVMVKKAYINISFSNHLQQEKVKEVDAAFVKELVYGVIERKYTLDFILSFFVKRFPDARVLLLLEMGLYQILYLDRVPDYAAINETVEVAKKFIGERVASFINAVLRSYLREKEKVKFPDKKDLRRYLKVTYSYPDWIIERFLKNFDEEKSEKLLMSLNEKPEISYRVNTLKISPEEFEKKLKEEGVSYKKGYYLREAFYIDLKNPENHYFYKEGLIHPQDEASMLVSKILAPKKGEMVMDVCAAPGGKTTHISQIMENTGEVVAFDLHLHRLKLIEENLRRLGILNVRTELFDATSVNEKYLGKADRVLADVPCTGIGIIRKKPDIKLKNYDEVEIRNMIEKQYNILKSSSLYLKKGGVLVYSTCTIGKEENQEVIERFLREHKNFEAVDISDCLPSNLKVETSKKGYIQTTPLEHKIDGFFIAKLKRIY